MKESQPRVPLTRSVQVPAGGATLEGDLFIPVNARGTVLFAHGSGSSRLSPRNRYVAQVLNEAGLGTLLIDLLTAEEELVDQQSHNLRFDIPLLSERLTHAVDWLTNDDDTRTLPIGTFGASTGAAAALYAAAERPQTVRAVVSRGGRPDLAESVLHRVTAPTLLIVGELDTPVIAMNRQALAQIKGEKRLELVPGATHLFEEAGTLEHAAGLARSWFHHHLRP